MRLTHLEVTDHRNIAHAELHPDPHLTVLCGPNGQGKTNLLEAIWLLTGGKSFRGSKDAELIRRGCDFSVIEGAFETQDVEKSMPATAFLGKKEKLTGKFSLCIVLKCMVDVFVGIFIIASEYSKLFTTKRRKKWTLTVTVLSFTL